MGRLIQTALGVVALFVAYESLRSGIDFWDGVIEHKNFYTFNNSLPFDLTAGDKIPLSEIRPTSFLAFGSSALSGGIGFALLRRTFR